MIVEDMNAHMTKYWLEVDLNRVIVQNATPLLFQIRIRRLVCHAHKARQLWLEHIKISGDKKNYIVDVILDPIKTKTDNV